MKIYWSVPIYTVYNAHVYFFVAYEMACELGDTRILDILVGYGAPIESMMTLIKAASTKHHIHVLDWLWSHGAVLLDLTVRCTLLEVNQIVTTHSTPLIMHTACCSNNIYPFKYLVRSSLGAIQLPLT